MLAVFFGVFALAPDFAVARVFDLKRESFASYLNFSYGPSAAADGAFAGESAATGYSGKIDQNIVAEFGFVYTTSVISWRFGLEILKPAVVNATATDAGGAELYGVKSDILGVMPKIALEMNFVTRNSYRLYLSGFAGQASVTVTNTYTNLTVAPNADFEMQYKGGASAYGGALGYELAAFDTTSVLLEVGYRKLVFDQLTYGKDVAADFSSASRSAGDTVKRDGGDNRKLDFSGAYVSLGARWWLF
ncbi:MAG: hypothetical protein KF802_06295 [Bdellovibrionaceae bacterium]|nr:hypothetical protein [Pseudobdellovibrionaceae bacterium]MBX3032532.1 hypothetical protein [Pseudobdellovibrionaceae bacterium]